jgi:hypothetical protein
MFSPHHHLNRTRPTLQPAIRVHFTRESTFKHKKYMMIYKKATAKMRMRMRMTKTIVRVKKARLRVGYNIHLSFRKT